MRTFKSWFTGFGGADVGAKMAGLAHLPGREYDPDVAAVSALNGFPSVVGDVRDADCDGEETPFWFHFSPSCKRASTANVNAGEASEDIEVAQACVRAIVALRPPFVSVENVRAYETFQAFRLIVRYLMDEGYNVAWWILNSADYGVPQTRERLFLVASRVAQVRRPIATHTKEPPHDAQLSLFGDAPLQRWNGWYDAIADLLPGLPDTELAEWQKKFLPDELKTMLIDGQSNMYGSSLTMRDSSDPAFTMTASLIKHLPKAPLIESQQHNRPPSFRQQDEPSVVVAGATSPSRWRAVMVEMTNTSRAPTVLDAEQPSMTVIAGHGRRPSHLPLATTPYRIVKLTPRCLARFQAFPDWYTLPDKVRLACTGIGNAVPPTMMQVLIEAQSTALRAAA